VVAWVSSEILWVHVELHHIPKICFMGILNMHLGSVTGQEKTQVHQFPGQVNFALGQMKIEVQRPSGQVKLASVVL